jgi:hypothetical protein
MKADFRVLLDACVLANFSVCDLLLRLSERPRLIVPYWSKEILAEVHRTQVDKLNGRPELADSFARELAISFPQSCVCGYENLLPLLNNDEGDRHLLRKNWHNHWNASAACKVKTEPEQSGPGTCRAGTGSACSNRASFRRS